MQYLNHRHSIHAREAKWEYRQHNGKASIAVSSVWGRELVNNKNPRRNTESNEDAAMDAWSHEEI